MSDKLHHVGFAVKDLSETKKAFEIIGVSFDRQVTDTERNLVFSFGKIGGMLIELVSPYDINKKCAVTGYIEKQQCTPYHVCITVDDIDSEVGRLRKKGFRQIGEKITSNVYGYVSSGVFLYSIGTGLIELVTEC